MHELLAGRIDHWQQEKRYLTKDGRVIWGRVTVSASPAANDPEILGLVMIENVTERNEAAEALRASEARLRQAQKLARIASWEWEPSTDQVVYTDEIFDVFGIDREHLEGSPASMVASVVHPDDRKLVAEAEERARETGTGQTTEYRIIRPDGEERWIRATGEAVYEDGALVRMIGANQDVTEQRATEAALRKARRLLEETQAISKLGGWEYEVAGGHATWTDEVYRIHGLRHDYDPDDVSRDISHYSPDSAPVLAEAFRRAVESGEAYDLELELDRPDGSRVWVRTIGRPVIENGTVVRVAGNIMDITERKQAEEALRRSNERLGLAQRASGAGVWDWDMITDTLVWSPELLVLFGLPDDAEASFDTWRAVVHPEDAEVAQARISSAVENHVPLDQEYRIIRPDGEVVWIETAGSTSYDETGLPMRMLGICMDITERKRAERERLELDHRFQQSQKLESLGTLAGGVAHDFNNILTTILGNADLALSELPPSAPARQNLLEIAQAAGRAAGLCRQMLAYSGRGRFVIESIDLSALVEGMADLIQSTLNKKTLLRLRLGKELPSIQGDASQIAQVIMILAVNASEAIGEENGVITISTSAVECTPEYLRDVHSEEQLLPGLYLSLEVSDTGVGMDRETRERILEPFFSTKFVGRGLGIPAMFGIVRGHKGALKVHSEPGRGSTFTILLPASARTAEPRIRGSAREHADQPEEGTVLLVDDDESLRLVTEKLLSRLGYHVLTARDGLEALTVFGQHHAEIALILLDLTMPNMDGEEAFHALRGLDPHVRVVMSSGYTEQEVTARFAGLGIAGFLHKPYTLAELRERMKAALTVPDG